MATRAPTEKEAFFFLTIMQCMTNKPEVNWTEVANRAGYSNAACAKTRFGQIKKQIGYKEDGSRATPTPTKGRAPVGSGTNTTPSKVKKTRTPRKPKAAQAKAEPEAEGGAGEQDKAAQAKGEPKAEGRAAEQDKAIVKEEAMEKAVEEGADAYTFDNPIHEQLFHSYQLASYEDEDAELDYTN